MAPRSPSTVRRFHRAVAIIAVAPLLLTAASGSLYSLLLERGIDAFWLLKLHTGRFGPVDLQPHYALILGGLTLLTAVSGLTVVLPRRT